MNVSVPIGGLIRRARGHVGRGQFGPRSTLLYIERGEKNASLETISRYVRRLEDLRLDSQPLSSLLHADVYYDEIYEAEESDKGSEMFDLTLDQVGLDATFVLGNGLVVHNCAGWGDPGYVSRWTMEIKNDLDYPVLVPVGAYVAQIIFERIEGEGRLYAKHYNAGPDVWTPEHMLPKAIHDQR